jgi:hypothetical protein
MYEPDYANLGMMLSDLRIEAITEWREKYAANVARRDLFANHLRRVTLVCHEHPGGYFSVMVRCLPRKVWQEETYIFKVQRVADMYYRH